MIRFTMLFEFSVESTVSFSNAGWILTMDRGRDEAGERRVKNRNTPDGCYCVEPMNEERLDS